jgi:hypothetical protein
VFEVTYAQDKFLDADVVFRRFPKSEIQMKHLKSAQMP